MSSENGFIGIFDLGTTSVRFIIFNTSGKVISQSFEQIKQFYPQPDWVEEDPAEIWNAAQNVAAKSLKKANIDSGQIIVLGITNQRESTLVWDKRNGQPLSRLIVWQDRRTSSRCSELKMLGYENKIKEKTGLTIDPYFSATKLEWILQNNEMFRESKESQRSRGTQGSRWGNRQDRNYGKFAFGTLDSWVIFKLTGNHLTDASNASRTMLFNIFKDTWDEELLDIFNIPSSMMPEVLPSFGKSIYGKTFENSIFGRKIPVSSVFGDQQAALFGQKCFKVGDIKCTYGTGAFLMVNTGKSGIISKNNLLTTIFFKSNTGENHYALEGSVYNTGSIFQWLKENLAVISSYDEIEKLGKEVYYQDNLFIVPAFTGLGAPYWDPYARGMIIGLTRSTGKKEIVRASLESVAYSTVDVLKAMQKDCRKKFNRIKIDGGVSQNNLFCQILADLTGIKILRFDLKEITALGAMYGASLGIGLYRSIAEIEEKTGRVEEEFIPDIDINLRNRLYKRWRRALARSIKWAI
jgi:glycerol kinase